MTSGNCAIAAFTHSLLSAFIFFLPMLPSLDPKIASSSFGTMSSVNEASTSAGTAGAMNSCFATPRSATIIFCHAWIFSISSETVANPFSSVSSDTSFAPTSIILMRPSLPHARRSMRGPSASRSLYVGFTMNVPAVSPCSRRTAETGPFHGMFDVASASDAALTASTSVS